MNSKPSLSDLQRAEKYWSTYRQSITREAQAGNSNTIDATLSSATFTTGTQYRPPLLLDLEIHAFWHTLICAAKAYNSDNAKQDSLVRYVLYMREMGTVKGGVHGGPQHQNTVLRTSNGQVVWSDLPYLVEDLEQACTDVSLSGVERMNLHSFIARLASVGVCGDALTGCALLLFREAFETADTESESKQKGLVEDFLPALTMWGFYAPHKLAAVLRRSSFSDDGVVISAEACRLGSLAEDWGVVEGGWNKARWAFWRTRIEEGAKGNREAEQLLEMMVMIENDNRLV